MELLIIAWLAFAGIGVASVVTDRSDSRQLVGRDVRLIQQTRETIQTEEVLKDWSQK